MTTISGFADGLLDGTIPQEDSQKYIAIIAEETRRLSRLVRRMLDLSRMQSVDTSKLLNSSFDVTEVARNAVLALGPKMDDKKLDVVVELPEEEVLVRGESDTIMQVIYNILDNAVKFAHEGGTVKLRIWKQDQKANVAIGDTGETIPEDDLPMIFDRFHKSDRSRSLDRDGVGLGLYIVKAILTAYGEDIKVTSKDGWTEFVFTLTLK
jgi:signal transduction histidine kinase